MSLCRFPFQDVRMSPQPLYAHPSCSLREEAASSQQLPSCSLGGPLMLGGSFQSMSPESQRLLPTSMTSNPFHSGAVQWIPELGEFDSVDRIHGGNGTVPGDHRDIAGTTTTAVTAAAAGASLGSIPSLMTLMMFHNVPGGVNGAVGTATSGAAGLPSGYITASSSAIYSATDSAPTSVTHGHRPVSLATLVGVEHRMPRRIVPLAAHSAGASTMASLMESVGSSLMHPQQQQQPCLHRHRVLRRSCGDWAADASDEDDDDIHDGDTEDSQEEEEPLACHGGNIFSSSQRCA